MHRAELPHGKQVRVEARPDRQPGLQPVQDRVSGAAIDGPGQAECAGHGPEPVHALLSRPEVLLGPGPGPAASDAGDRALHPPAPFPERLRGGVPQHLQPVGGLPGQRLQLACRVARQRQHGGGGPVGERPDGAHRVLGERLQPARRLARDGLHGPGGLVGERPQRLSRPLRERQSRPRGADGNRRRRAGQPGGQAQRGRQARGRGGLVTGQGQRAPQLGLGAQAEIGLRAAILRRRARSFPVGVRGVPASSWRHLDPPAVRPPSTHTICRGEA